MAYSELIKNFEKVRAYMREFYVYGFKSRTEYDAKSARSYDDERRRLESWLGDCMRFTQTPEGKNVFLSVDSRVTRKNPFYKAWKAKSFTDGDITLHFAIFDILYDPETKMTLTELIEEIDQRLSSSMAFDESTLRKKLKEYAEEGIIRMEKDGRKVLYSRAPDTDITALHDVIDFFSEVAPCGVIGSFLQDRQPKHPELFSFIRIAVAGSQRRSGVTVTAFNLASWLAARGAEVAYIEVNQNRHLQLLLNIYEAAPDGEHYTIDGIDCYLTNEPDKAYQFIIYDCGVMQTPTSIFRDAEHRLLCGSVLPYEIPVFHKALSECGSLEVRPVAICVPQEIQEYCTELFGEDVQIAAASHDLFAKQVNGQIYRPLVEKYIAGEKRL